jgi:hypothetical protein
MNRLEELEIMYLNAIDEVTEADSDGGEYERTLKATKERDRLYGLLTEERKKGKQS